MLPVIFAKKSSASTVCSGSSAAGAEDGGAGALSRGGVAHRSAQDYKIGVLGFSSGGHLSAAISTHFAKRLHPPVDAADKESCRPDFAVVIYPGHLSIAAAEWDAKQGSFAVSAKLQWNFNTRKMGFRALKASHFLE